MLTFDSPLSSIFILGGNSPPGIYFMHHLAEAGMTATAVSRRLFDLPPGFTNHLVDQNNPQDWNAPAGAVIVSFLPLWILADFLPRLTKARAIIAIGSTSRFSKTKSKDSQERSLAERLMTAEASLQQWAGDLGITWTLLRPTLVYDCKTDKNITRMALFIRRWRFLPIAIPSNGLRQPIHADDVAKAAFMCINNPAAANRAFNISGGEMLSYRAMAERVFVALDQKPRFITLPAFLLQIIFRMVKILGIDTKSGFSPAMFERMNEDLIFDTVKGLVALNYQPGLFKPDFSQLYLHQ